MPPPLFSKPTCSLLVIIAVISIPTVRSDYPPISALSPCPHAAADLMLSVHSFPFHCLSRALHPLLLTLSFIFSLHLEFVGLGCGWAAVVFRGSWVSTVVRGGSLRWFGEWILQFDIGPNLFIQKIEIKCNTYYLEEDMTMTGSLALSREEQAELMRNNKKVKNVNHTDYGEGQDAMPSSPNHSYGPWSRATSFKDKLIGEIPGAFSQAFNLVDSMEDDSDSDEGEVEALREGLAAVKFSKDFKRQI
nr:hypothetical protein CFP56_02138 [Quercus suber]